MLSPKLFKRFLRKYNIFLKFLAFAGFALFLTCQFLNFFSIKKIEIKNKKKQEILGLKQAYGKNIFFFNLERFQRDLQELNPFVKRIKTQKKYPNRLIVEIFFREPLCYLKVRNGYYLLDEEGRVLQRLREKNSGFPTINFYQLFNFQDFSPGEYIEYVELELALKFLKLMQQFGIKVNRVDILRGDMIRFNLQGNNFSIRKIYASVDKEIDKQLWELQQLLKYLKISGKKVQEIDLRFKRPILRN